VWEALENYPAYLGEGLDWDRALRVSRRFAKTLASWSMHPDGRGVVQATFDAVAVTSKRAFTQIESEVQRVLDPPKRLEPASRKSPKSTARSPIEQARQLAERLWGL
jgi:hypothetical protein